MEIFQLTMLFIIIRRRNTKRNSAQYVGSGSQKAPEVNYWHMAKYSGSESLILQKRWLYFPIRGKVFFDRTRIETPAGTREEGRVGGWKIRTLEIRRLALHVEQGVIEIEDQKTLPATRLVDDIHIDCIYKRAMRVK